MTFCGEWSSSSTDLSPCIFRPLQALLTLGLEALLLLSRSLKATRTSREDGKLTHSGSILTTVGLCCVHLILVIKQVCFLQAYERPFHSRSAFLIYSLIV